jgi:hypothetical protein
VKHLSKMSKSWSKHKTFNSVLPYDIYMKMTAFWDIALCSIKVDQRCYLLTCHCENQKSQMQYLYTTSNQKSQMQYLYTTSNYSHNKDTTKT